MMAFIAVVIYLITTRKYANRVEMLWIIATAVKHDMPLPELIRGQARQSWGKRKRMLFEMASDLSGGASLAEAVDTYRLVIPEQGRLAIHVGSDSGTLDQSLDAALEYLERRPQEVHRNIQMIFFYLVAVLLIWLTIASFIMYWIVPKFEDIFLGVGVEFPAVTVTFIDFADLLVNYFYLLPLVFLCLVPVGVFFASLVTGGLDLPDKGYYPFRLEMLWKPNALGRWIFYLLVKLGVRFTPRRASADILRYLGVVAQADQPVVRVIDTLSQYYKAGDIRRRLDSVKERIKQGGVLWEALAAKGFLSKQKAALLHTAEIAGDLPYALREKSLQFEKEHQHRMICFLEYVRIAAVLMLCCMTALFAISLFMPLIKLMNELS